MARYFFQRNHFYDYRVSFYVLKLWQWIPVVSRVITATLVVRGLKTQAVLTWDKGTEAPSCPRPSVRFACKMTRKHIQLIQVQKVLRLILSSSSGRCLTVLRNSYSAKS
jgi:hypothetical protein